jgi:hypothetical protein
MWALFEGSIWLAVLVEHRRSGALVIDPFEAAVQPPD